MKNYNIISWNVNGVRAIIKKDFLRDIKEIDPDVICLQETKAGYEDALKALEVMKEYNIYVNSSKARKGYSGTAIISKTPPLKISNEGKMINRPSDRDEKEENLKAFEE